MPDWTAVPAFQVLHFLETTYHHAPGRVVLLDHAIERFRQAHGKISRKDFIASLPACCPVGTAPWHDSLIGVGNLSSSPGDPTRPALMLKGTRLVNRRLTVEQLCDAREARLWPK